MLVPYKPLKVLHFIGTVSEYYVRTALIKFIMCCLHRYLFLTGGNDGAVRLYHVLERRPLFEWEPTPPPGTIGMSINKIFIESVL
jgi:hypothetical protein